MEWSDAVRVARRLPGVEVSTSYGTPALKVAGKLLTRLRPEDNSLTLHDVPVEERETLIETQPEIFHTTPHYDGHPIVLARLALISEPDLQGFLTRRWRTIAPRRVVAAFNAELATVGAQGA